MAQLSSPGVAVTVIDESFYTPAAAGTVPLIVVASAEGKQNGSATGTAPGTLAANAGQVYLLTSQKDLADTFGTPVFKTDANNNPIHAGEQNEYGLQAAYSYLGVSNRAYVVRADMDLSQLDAASEAPAGVPANGTYWFDTATTKFGIFEWNNATAQNGGQSFTVKYPTIITSEARLTAGSGSAPRNSIGTFGDYAIDATGVVLEVYYKNASNQWVKVGSEQWSASHPTVSGTAAVSTITTANDGDFTINGSFIVVPSNSTAETIASAVNGAAIAGVTAAASNSRIMLYSTGTDITLSSAAGTPINVTNTSLVVGRNYRIATLGTVSNGDWTTLGVVGTPTVGGEFTAASAVTVTGGATVTVDTIDLSLLGLTAGTYKAPALAIDPHTRPPQFKLSGDNRPTGSVWLKTTSPNLGADWIVRSYSTSSSSWTEQAAPLYASNQAALAALDAAGGGLNLARNALYAQYNVFEGTPKAANFKLFYRAGTGATTIQSVSFLAGPVFTPGTTDISFTISETLRGNAVLGAAKTVSITANIPATGPLQGQQLAEAISSTAGLVNILAEYDSVTGIVTISHKLGGDFRIVDTTGDFETAFPVLTTTNLYVDPVDLNTADGFTPAGNLFVATLWNATVAGEPFATVSADEPSSVTADGQLWYNSMIDEIDIMVHDGVNGWVGYLNGNFSGGGNTDPEGPMVSATRPVTQANGDALVNGDLWIDTSDLENFPQIYKYSADLARWVLVDTSDQTTEDGILFRDARWSVDGGAADGNTASTIKALLTSDFVDFDAPDPALYPQGMLLWNLRRSGFNVKRFVRDYVDQFDRNPRQEDEPMTLYYPHRWVSEAGNQENGSGTFGRKAQRKVVIQALQALVNANQQIRDEESRVFNLIACPGYPELVGEMVSLNYDRGLTAFVVADTPPRLTPDATSLSNWGNNVNGALEDNDLGLVSSDEYLGFFYPWGFTSDNIGNNVVVPPSHMMLRTIALSDNVSYPWFAPAGTRRGGITNATAVGYITAEGEFQSVALNNGQRDTLASIKVNPLTFITGTGLVNYGQYTRARNASSLDRINVARLVIYLRRQFAQLAKPYVFEPNDKITRDEIKQAAESLLLELVGQRALYDYLVVCDESNNTPARIDRSELYLDVAIEPVKAVEFIYIPLRLKNTGEIKGLG